MATTAYLRVSSGSQDVANQKLAILEYARQKKFPVDDFVEVQISSRKNPHQRGIDGMIERLAPGDRLIVSELSRLGRSLGQVIYIVHELVKRKIRFTAIKENIHFEGKQDLQTKVMAVLFGLFVEVERDLISERTLEGLASARAKGRLLGRPKGSLGKSRLGGKEEEIRILLQKQVSKASIAKIVGVTRPTIHRFIETRRLAQETVKRAIPRKSHTGPPDKIARKSALTDGFTLIELSIVLVIIGLIVGGVLVGQDLIRSAEVRATITQIEKYNTAVNTFRGKYNNQLPGDIDATDAAQFGFAARGRYAGEGDGNGVIEGVVSNSAGQNYGAQEGGGETAMFWVDLSVAHLIDSGFNSASETNVPVADITAATTPNIDAFLPQAKLGKGNYIYVYSLQHTNYYGLSAVTALGGQTLDLLHSDQTTGGSFSVQEAYSIDKKIDDGMPLTGNVLAQFANCCDSGSFSVAGSTSVLYAAFGGPASIANWPWSGSCYDNGGVAGVQPNYSMSNAASMNCTLSFGFQ